MLWCYWWRSWVWWSTMTAVRNETGHRLIWTLCGTYLLSLKDTVTTLIILAMAIGERYPLICLWSHHGGDRTTVYFAMAHHIEGDWNMERYYWYAFWIRICAKKCVPRRIWQMDLHITCLPILHALITILHPYHFIVYFDISFVLALSFRGYWYVYHNIISSYKGGALPACANKRINLPF